ncbi:MAG: porin [Fuscovulum sp.]|nr:porin [Fuscovulum sp.]
MKKLLLATTMLAGTAGFAAAEVAVSGYAEMGIWSDSAGDIAFWQDVEVTFTMSGTTDGGLEFGAAIDLDEGNVALNDDSGTTVYISGSFGKLTMGDTDGALDWAVQDAGALTSIADDHTTHVAYFGASGLDAQGDNQVARYENTFGAISFAISAEQEDDGAAGGPDDIWGVGVKYTADLGGTALNLGLGYQKGNFANVNATATGVSVGAELASGFSASLGFIQYDLEPAAAVDFDHVGLGLTYKSGALSVNANYGEISPDVGASLDSYGLAVNYDLGGGAVVMAGWGSDVSIAAGDQDQWSIGLGMSF